jgi:AraC-like DNA-binding protein
LLTEIVNLLGGSERGRGERFEEAIIEIVDEALNGAAVDGPPQRFSDYRIRRAMAQLRLEPHLHPDFRLVASQVGLSRSRFFQQFKTSVGIAPSMYVDGLLLEEAIEMLVHSDRSLEEISVDLGFAAQSSFSRFFKERVGFPPNAVRQAALLN